MERLQKFLAQAGVDSRRNCEKLIVEGKVKVNGHTVKELGVKVEPSKDIVHVSGKRILLEEELVYYMLNKPRGYLSTAKDERGRKTVMDLVNSKYRVFPVGRLDQNTSGLLLLTNDGDLTHKLTHPSQEIEKTYVIKVKPIPEKDRLNYLRKGGDIGVYTIAPTEIRLKVSDEQTATFEVKIHEGKNRQVRNMFEFIGCEVVTLKRTNIGKLTLKGLPVGKCRKLEEDELRYLKKLVQ